MGKEQERGGEAEDTVGDDFKGEEVKQLSCVYLLGFHQIPSSIPLF